MTIPLTIGPGTTPAHWHEGDSFSLGYQVAGMFLRDPRFCPCLTWAEAQWLHRSELNAILRFGPDEDAVAMVNSLKGLAT